MSNDVKSSHTSISILHSEHVFVLSLLARCLLVFRFWIFCKCKDMAWMKKCSIAGSETIEGRGYQTMWCEVR